MATIPIVQLFRNSNIISGRSAAIDTLERQKEYVPDGGLILATYSSDNGVKTLLGIVRNSGSENAQITIMDVEGAAENVQDAIDALSAYTNTKLTEEKNARESADNTLQTNIDNLSSSTDTKINAEVTRATKKEAELSSTITSNYTTLSTAIDDEKKRAEAKESDLNAKIQALDGSLGDTVSTTVASGEYSSTDKAIYLKNASGETLSTIDATAFIKDGMVTSVSVVGENLVITFNTDAGREDILIPISDIFNAENYYTKTEIDTKVDGINSTLASYGETTSQSLNDLGTRLTEETTARQLGDTTIQGNIDTLSSSTDTKIANETTARQSGDTTLQTNIDNVNSGLTAHTANTVVHVTQEDKDKWNTPTDLSNYYTKEEVDTAIEDLDVTGQLKNHYTKAEVDAKDAAINATIESLSSDTKTKIDAEIAARQSGDTTLQTNIDNVNSGLTSHTADTTIHVTQADKDKWNTPTDLSNYYTKSEVDEAISNVDVTGQLQNYYTKTEVDEKDAAINSTIEAYGQVTSQALNDLGTRLDDYGKVTSQSLNDLSTKFGDYYTKTEVDTAISNVDVTGQLQNYYTKTEVDSKDATLQTALDALSSSTDTKIASETTERQNADNTLQGNINNVNSGLTAHTANTTVHVTQADKDKWNTPTDLSNYYTKAEVDGKDATLQTALDALGAHVSENEDIVSQSLNDLNNRIGDTYVKSYIDALEARIAELEAKFLNMENNGLQAGEY